jgi:hypothetical protein
VLGSSVPPTTNPAKPEHIGEHGVLKRGNAATRSTGIYPATTNRTGTGTLALCPSHLLLKHGLLSGLLLRHAGFLKRPVREHKLALDSLENIRGRSELLRLRQLVGKVVIAFLRLLDSGKPIGPAKRPTLTIERKCTAKLGSSGDRSHRLLRTNTNILRLRWLRNHPAHTIRILHF